MPETFLFQGTVTFVCTSERKGTQKTAVPSIELVRGLGIAGDAHAGNGHRQVSFLAEERIEEMRARGLDLPPGAFGENVVTRGVDLAGLAVGRRFRLGERAVLQVTQHGKECHTRCAIFYQAGTCIMPAFGLFARVVRGGRVAPGDSLRTDPDLDRYRFAVVTLSDRGATGERPDTSGPLVASIVEEALAGEALCVAKTLLPDDRDALAAELVRLCDEEVCDLVLTTGGTGLSPRDVTPEATLSVVDREVPGIAEAMRAAGLAHTPHAMLSRGVCGQRGSSLVLNLSGSPRAVREQLGVVLPVLGHALRMASGIPADCAAEVRQ